VKTIDALKSDEKLLINEQLLVDFFNFFDIQFPLKYNILKYFSDDDIRHIIDKGKNLTKQDKAEFILYLSAKCETNNFDKNIIYSNEDFSKIRWNKYYSKDVE
jgi:hypothetical protein